jgi:hypothetical protein
MVAASSTAIIISEFCVDAWDAPHRAGTGSAIRRAQARRDSAMDDAIGSAVSGRVSSTGMRMYQIVCVSGETNRHSTVASGFSDEAEAWDTAQNWINRRFLDAAYDHSRECWWLLDAHREIYRIMIHKG